jgi:glutamate--cysteine ligase catalytic subunit
MLRPLDFRNPEERDPASEKYVHKSMFDTVNMYISNHEYYNDDALNDTPQIPSNPDHMTIFRENGMPERVAQYYG